MNHYGSLTYGHYVSVVKNPYDHTWYKYDDQFRIPISESQIPKDSAYILFYVRKDTQHRKLHDIFPDPTQLFPGKPVRTKHGEGFILGAKSPDFQKAQVEEEQYYYVMIRGQTYELPKDALQSDVEEIRESSRA